MTVTQFLSLFESQLAEQEYDGAMRTLKQLQAMGIEEYQSQILTARFYDLTDRSAEAEVIYRKILKSPAQTSIVNQARQGLQVIYDREKHLREAAIALAMTEPAAKSPGILYLLPISIDKKEKAAEVLARIFQLDIYTARMHLPSRYFKIYRLGKLGELAVYAQQLRLGGVPASAIGLQPLKQIPIHTVRYFEQDTNNNGLVAITDKQEIVIGWTEIRAQVRGKIPIFEEVVMGVDRHYKIVKEEQTKDYIEICDLHCADFILRFHYLGYEFGQGKQFAVTLPTVQARWQALLKWLEASVQVDLHDDFLAFGEMALIFTDMLEEIVPHLVLSRRKESLWDNCFQLYSCTLFLFGNYTNLQD